MSKQKVNPTITPAEAWEVVRDHFIALTEVNEETSDEVSAVLGLPKVEDDNKEHWEEVLNKKGNTYTDEMRHLMRSSESFERFVFLSYINWMATGKMKAMREVKETVGLDLLKQLMKR